MGLDDIQTFVRAIWLHFTAYRCYGEVQQLRSGLWNTLNFGHLVTANPQAIRSLFVSRQQNLTAIDMQELFDVQYSPQGSNKRSHEEAVIINWFNLLQDCEG